MTPGGTVTTFTGRRGVVEAILPDPYRHGHDRVQVRLVCHVIGERERGESVAISCIYAARDVRPDIGELPF